jgi:WD40 repeat protein
MVIGMMADCYSYLPSPHPSHLMALILWMFGCDVDSAAVTALRYNESGSLLVSGSADTDLIVWDPVAESGLVRLRGHSKPITDVRFLEKGNHRHIISSSKDHLIKIWDLDTQHCCQTLVHHKSEVWAIDVNHNETRLVSGSGDRHIGVWILRGGVGDDTNDSSSSTDAPPPLEQKGKGKGAAVTKKEGKAEAAKNVTGKRQRSEEEVCRPHHQF